MTHLAPPRPLWLVPLLLAAILAAALPAWTPLYSQQTVQLQGRVVNGTQGATLNPGLTVSLHSFDPQTGGVTTQAAPLDPEGIFSFSVSVSGGEKTYAAAIDYAGHRYGSPLTSLEAWPNGLTLTVYESTREVAVISVQQHVMVLGRVEPSGRVMEAVELVTLTNDSDLTLVPDLTNVGPGMFSFLRFSLPPDATDFDVQTDLVGGEIIPVGTGFALTAPVTPGRHNVTFRYAFPYQGSSFAYNQNLPQGAAAFRVMVPRRLGPIQVNGLGPPSPLDIEGAVFNVWSGQDIPPGQGVQLQLGNLPQPSSWQRFTAWTGNTALWLVVIPSALGAALAAVLLYGAIRGPQPAAVNLPLPPAANIPARFTPERQRLVGEIADLDHRFQQGTLPEAEYRPQRNALKAGLLAEVQPVSPIPEAD